MTLTHQGIPQRKTAAVVDSNQIMTGEWKGGVLLRIAGSLQTGHILRVYFRRKNNTVQLPKNNIFCGKQSACTGFLSASPPPSPQTQCYMLEKPSEATKASKGIVFYSLAQVRYSFQYSGKRSTCAHSITRTRGRVLPACDLNEIGSLGFEITYVTVM